MKIEESKNHYHVYHVTKKTKFSFISSILNYKIEYAILYFINWLDFTEMNIDTLIFLQNTIKQLMILGINSLT